MSHSGYQQPCSHLQARSDIENGVDATLRINNDCVGSRVDIWSGIMPHNKALQLTANPLRGLSAAELGR